MMTLVLRIIEADHTTCQAAYVRGLDKKTKIKQTKIKQNNNKFTWVMCVYH